MRTRGDDFVDVKNVLVIAYFYPPYDTTAALEASKLTRYLPDHGWSPVVLSATNDYAPSLPLEVEEDRVHRTHQFDVNRLPKLFLANKRDPYAGYVANQVSHVGRFAGRLGRAYRQVVDVPDAQVGWLPFAIKEGRQLLERYRPDLIFSIGGPFTSHLIARRLARGSRLPWFADFRDLWTDNHFFHRVKPISFLERGLESRTMTAASGLSAATPAWAEILERRFAKPTWVIPNGFDPKDHDVDARPRERFTLTYTGVLYRGAQDVEPLLDALVDLRKERVLGPSNFELRFVGRFLSGLRSDVSRRELNDVVTFHDTVSHTAALAMQAESAALLFLLWTKPEGRGWLSAKVYEYMASGRPILAIGPSGVDAGRLVEEMGAGKVVAHKSAIAATLRSWMDEFAANGFIKQRADASKLEIYEWENISGRLAEAFDETLDHCSDS